MGRYNKYPSQDILIFFFPFIQLDLTNPKSILNYLDIDFSPTRSLLYSSICFIMFGAHLLQQKSGCHRWSLGIPSQWWCIFVVTNSPEWSSGLCHRSYRAMPFIAWIASSDISCFLTMFMVTVASGQKNHRLLKKELDVDSLKAQLRVKNKDTLHQSSCQYVLSTYTSDQYIIYRHTLEKIRYYQYRSLWLQSMYTLHCYGVGYCSSVF